MMKKSFLLLCFILGCAACKESGPTRPYFETKKHTNLSAVTQQDVEEHLSLLSKEDADFAQSSIGRKNLLQVIVREKLITQDALAQGIDQTEDFRLLTEQKRQQLSQVYQTYVEQTLQNLWYEKQAAAFHISDEEIAQYYKKYPYEMTIKQIIVDNAETAEQVLRTLKSSPGRWREMERQYSVAPETLRGKSVAFMPGEFLPEIEVIAANSFVGSVQGFIKTAFGFHIIMKTGEKRLVQTEATPRIRAVLENKKLDKILETLQNKYEVNVYDENE